MTTITRLATDRQTAYARSLVTDRDVLPGMNATDALAWFDATLAEHVAVPHRCRRAAHVPRHPLIPPVPGPLPVGPGTGPARTDNRRPAMTEYRVTFGQQYRRDPHPHLALAHPDGWVTILAADEGAARQQALTLLDVKWSMIYAPEEDGYPDTDFYPRGELLRVIAPTTGAVHLLTGEHEGEQVLVHVWADGTGEVATRRDARWGIPSPLTPAP